MNLAFNRIADANKLLSHKVKYSFAKINAGRAVIAVANQKFV
ncbi:hypothetical protein [Daejeonella sp.]|jgi:hypothetical protein